MIHITVIFIKKFCALALKACNKSYFMILGILSLGSVLIQ